MRTPIAVLVALVSSVAIADLRDYVDPFVGTAGTGHTFPGACVPFGMIQAGPDTGNDDCGQMSAWRLFSAMGFYPLLKHSEIMSGAELVFEMCE